MGSIFRSSILLSSKLSLSSPVTFQKLPIAIQECTRQFSCTTLKDVLREKIPIEREKIKNFRQEHGSHVIGEISVDMVYTGMRGIKGLLCETSVLDPNEGIRFRGYSIPECQELLPKLPGGQEPLPEGLFWLLTTGEIPSDEQALELSKEWADRSSVPPHILKMLSQFPTNLHPMAQLSSAIAALHSESKFAKAYQSGIPRSQYWEYAFEDGMDLIARLPIIAAAIYRNTYKSGFDPKDIDRNSDWSKNFSLMLGYDSFQFFELMRMFLTLLSDHEGGNVSSHTCHLVGSALSDPYLSFSAGMAGLAGPLHGLANQQVIIFVKRIVDTIGIDATEDQLREFVLNELKEKRVVPGCGHAVLRKTDPRFVCQNDFALKHLPNDPLFKLVSRIYTVVPKVLSSTGKVQNPHPNVDANSGVLFQHYGMTETNFYTVLIGVSRSLGLMASLIWSRALNLPIERPKSLSTKDLIKLVKAS